jgi:hypothetical protein
MVTQAKRAGNFQKSRVLRGMREAEEWEEGGNCSVREKPVFLAELPWNKAILI